jgi:acyl carrier protein
MANNLAHVIAVVGLAGRFPGAAPIEALAHDADPLAPEGVPAAPDLEPGGAEGHGLAAGTAERRLLLERAWEAMRHAGCASRGETARIGLFVGMGGTGGMNGAPDGDGPVAEAARELGLRGPALAVHGPLSPALAAVERACQSLRRAECDLALAGAVSAGGQEPAAGVMVLKRLAPAMAEGDRVLAVVRGSAIQPPAPAPRLAREEGEEGGPRRERPALATEYVPPANPLEEAIASLWQERLGIDRVGAQDNFFELGGNSLLGTQILAALREWLDQEIPTVSLYEGPTVGGLARVILQGGGSASSSRGYDAVRERGERRRRKLQRLAQEATEGAGG